MGMLWRVTLGEMGEHLDQSRSMWFVEMLDGSHYKYSRAHLDQYTTRKGETIQALSQRYSDPQVFRASSVGSRRGFQESTSHILRKVEFATIDGGGWKIVWHPCLAENIRYLVVVVR